MAENTTKATEVSAHTFIDAVADPVRREDARTLADLMARVSGAEARMWGPSIVGFGQVHYRYESGREGDMPEIAFSPRAKELVLYVLGFPEQAALLARLGKHKTGKSCLYIKRLADVDMSVLEQVVEASFRHTRDNPGAAHC